MIWAAAIVFLAALALLAWHMQRPKPRAVAISFARFVPKLPAAPSHSRFAPTWPRDRLPLACLLAAAALALWALLDGRREYEAGRPQHLGLRVVLDLSHSMSVEHGGKSRLALALARLDEARAHVGGSKARSSCLELVGVGAVPGPMQSLGLGGAIPAEIGEAPRFEGGEATALVAGASLPQGDCVLTHVLVLTDLPPSGMITADGADLVWDQVGDAVGNAGIRSVALTQSAFGQAMPEIRIEGVVSGLDLPTVLVMNGPSGQQEATIHPVPDAEGRWYATVAYGGAGEYHVRLLEGGGYSGDDHAVAHLRQSARTPVEWRLDELARPAGLSEGSGGDLLVTGSNRLAPADLVRPLLLTYQGFRASASGRQIGAFTEDAALFSVLNFDALEAALPLAFPAKLPPEFIPVLTDGEGGVLVARRPRPPGLIVPAPALELAEPARSLSLTLFFSALADLAISEPQYQPLEWRAATGEPIPDAWRESMTGRPLASPADLGRLAMVAEARTASPLWPWLVLGSLLSLLAERLLRVLGRTEAVQ